MQYPPPIASERQGSFVLSPHLRSLKRAFQDLEVRGGGGVGEILGHGEMDEIYIAWSTYGIFI
jgi:hypothetical protein